MLRLQLRGELLADVIGQPVPMPAADRARALIAWLALHPGAQPRTDVAEQLWPDTDADRARANLRTAIWAVRQSWGPAAAALETTRRTVGFRADQLCTDLDEFDEHGDVELLPGISDAWADDVRADDARRRMQHFAALAASAEHEGRAHDAIRHSEQVCALAPFDERAHRELLDRLLAAGERAHATLAVRTFTERLRTELGIAPSPATRAAHAQLSAPARAGPRPALYGRQAELARLTTHWRAARAGAGQVVVLTGEAGIGKSTLLGELVHRVTAAGGRTAIASALDVSEQTPFAVWLELAQSIVATLRAPSPQRSWPSELNRLSPELGARLGRAAIPPPVSPPELERLRIFEAVLRLTEYACADRPLLLAIDDAHRADTASLRLTAHVGRRLARLPVLVVIARRPGATRAELDTMLADLARLGVEHIAVGPVGTDDLAALTAATVADLSDAHLRQVVESAEGNPLLAVETARALAAGSAGPPANLRAAVRSLTGELPATTQHLVALLAAAGRPLRSAELARLGPQATPPIVAPAAANGLLQRSGSGLGFRHALLRRAAYDELPDPAGLHDQLAAVLDRGDAAELAWHLTAAGRGGEAASQWIAAAGRARAMGLFDEAAGFAQRAVELAPDDGAHWLELEEILAWSGRHQEMDTAWAEVTRLLDGPALVAAWARRGRQFRSVVCHPRASEQAYRRAAELLTDDVPAAVHADVLVGLAWGDAVAGDARAYEQLLSRAEALLSGQIGPRIASDIAEIRLQGLIRQGRFAAAAEVAIPAGLAADAARLVDRSYAVWVHAACAMTCAGDDEKALEFAEHAVAATRGLPALHVGCVATRAQLLARLGRHTEAAEAASEELAIAERLDSPEPLATAAHDAGLVAFAAGRYADAAELLETALGGPAAVSRPTAGLLRAEALARADRPQEAKQALRRATTEPVGRADQPWALVPRVAWVQGLIASAQGDLVLAERRYDEAAEGWTRMLATVATETAQGYLAMLVDLGRPPVVGLTEPKRELARIDDARAQLRQSIGVR